MHILRKRVEDDVLIDTIFHWTFVFLLQRIAKPHRILREDDSDSVDGGHVATVPEVMIQPPRADVEVRQPQSTLSDTGIYRRS